MEFSAIEFDYVFKIPTCPPCFLSLVGPTELAFAVQQTLILPSGLVLRCTQGNKQNVSDGYL